MDAQELRDFLIPRLKMPGKVDEVVDEIMALENDPEKAALDALVRNLARNSAQSATLLEERRLAAETILLHTRQTKKTEPPRPLLNEYHDDGTINKVYNAILASDLAIDGPAARGLIAVMQGAGILFREPRPSPGTVREY